MKYLLSWVQRPTTPPVPTNPATGTYQVAHRRKNLSGGYCAAVLGSNVSLPNTFQYQVYLDSGNLAEDEILIKNPAENVWRKVPSSRVSGGTVQVTESSAPSSWTAVTVAELADNQGSFSTSSLDFGSFGAASEPSRSLFLLNDGTDSIQTLHLGIRDTQGATVDVLDNRVQFTILGLFPGLGAGNPATTYNGSLVFGLGSKNAIAALVAPNQALRVQLKLINFPATGLLSTEIEAEVVLTPNFGSSPVPMGLDWVDGSLIWNQNYGHELLTEDPGSTGLLVQPFSVRLGSRIFSQDAEAALLPSQGTGDYNLFIERTGVLGTQLSSLGLGDTQLLLATYTWNSGTGALSNYKTQAQVQEDTKFLEPGAAIESGKWVTYNSSGKLVNGGSNVLGVAVTDQGHFVPFGYASLIVGAGQTVAVGDKLGPDGSFASQISATGTAIALEPGSSGDIILCFLLPGGGGGGSGPTDLTVSRTSTSVTVVSSTGTDGTISAATGTLAGVMSSTDKLKLDGIQSAATANSTDAQLRDRSTHTGTQLASTISNFVSQVQANQLPTNLGVSPLAGSVVVTSSTGTSATVPGATTSLAGVMAATDKLKLDGIQSAATANSTDAQLRDRSTHTGTQLASTVSDFSEAVDDRVNALVVAGNLISKTYNDPSNTLTISCTLNPIAGPGVPLLSGSDIRALKNTDGLVSVALSAGDQNVVVGDKAVRGYFTYSGTAQSLAGSAWSNYTAGSIVASNGVLGCSVASSGGTNNAVQITDAGYYLIVIGGYFAHPNTSSIRLLASINSGSGSNVTLKNATSSAFLDFTQSYSWVQNLSANAVIVPAFYVDSVTAGPINASITYMALRRIA